MTVVASHLTTKSMQQDLILFANCLRNFSESSQFINQYFRPQVGVLLQHRQRLMSTEHTNLNGVQPLFKQPTHCLMAI
jgi:hypothetical protein